MRQNIGHVPLLALVLAAGCARTQPEWDYTHDGGATTCEVHHVQMKRDTVPVLYGLVVPEPRYLQAEKESFPNANRQSWGGCSIGSESPQRARVLYCPECRKAESEFLAAEARGK